MKKRLLSALLALALVFVLLPTTALAGVTRGSDYDISINGTNYVFSDSETCYFKSSFTSTEPSSPYLKLTKSSDTITVTVSGYVTVSDISVHNNFSTQDKINLIITGNKGSTLNIECKDTYGAALETYQSGDITIKGGITVNANFSANNTNRNTDCHGISASKNLIITGKGTTVNAVNADHDAAAVKVGGNITVSDGAQLNATNKYYGSNNTDKAYAIKCGQLSISGNNTKVTAKTSNGKQAISGTVSDGDKLTFKVQLYLASSTLHQKPMDEALKYTHVEITQAPTDPYVFIAGKPAIMDQETPIPGGTGTYLYKKTTYNGSFLTLKGVDITGTSSGPARFIQFGKNGGYYTIQLEGENKISGFSSGIVAPEDPGVNDVTVVLSGSGSLDITANQYAIDMQVGKLKFENTGTIKLTTGYNYYVNPLNALRVKTGNISIDNTKYDIVGARQEKNYPTETISDSSAFTPDLLNGYTVGEETTLFKTITITPAAAKDSTISYNGKTLKQGETIKDGKGGTATVATKGNTITLNNFKGTKALSFEATLADSTLVLEGTSTLSSIVTTQKGLTISGSGSLTVGSIRVTNNDNISADLIITGGAHVTVNRPSEDKPAVEVSGNLTVTGDGTQLSAECTAATNPAIEVGGNVTISGNPGINAYTVKAHNKYATPRDRVEGLSPSEMPSAIEISGDSLSISNSARVMAKTDSDGAAVWMPAQKVISVADASLIAQNRSHNFSTISFGDESNMGNIYAKGQVNIVAENMLHSDSSLAHRAIKAHIYNHYSTGDSNPYYIKVVSEGVQSDKNVNVIPGHCTSTGGYKVTITRGDAYTTPQVAANYTIAGQTMHVGKYYKTDAKGNITDGTAQDYNIYCDSKNDFTLNNATISSTGTDVAINTNIRYETNVQHHIKLIGTNRINNTFKHAISAGSNSSTIIIEGVGNASDASLTINGNFLPIYSDGKVIINAEVVIVNTTDDNSFKGLISTSDGKGAFDLGSGYKCYASTSTTGTPLEEFNSANYSTYKYLRVTTQTLETGGGSTHQHVEGPWEADTQGGHHIKKCTECGEVMISEEHRYNYTYESPTTHKVNCGVCGVNFVRAHSYTDSYVPTVDGTQHHGKCICGAEETTLRDHVFVNGVCVCGVTQSGGNPTPDVPAAPTGLVGVAPTSENGNGKITGTTAQMEYATSLEGDWTACANDSTDVPAGKYYVRMKKTDNTPAGEAVEVTVPAYSGTGEIVPPTPDNPGTIVIIRPAEEEKPAQQPNPSTGANDLVGLAVAAAVAAALGSAALLRKHD